MCLVNNPRKTEIEKELEALAAKKASLEKELSNLPKPPLRGFVNIYLNNLYSSAFHKTSDKAKACANLHTLRVAVPVVEDIPIVLTKRMAKEAVDAYNFSKQSYDNDQRKVNGVEGLLKYLGVNVILSEELATK